MHGPYGSGAQVAVNLIGFTAGFFIAALLLGLTLRAARLPGTPRANIVFALCGLIWNAGGLLSTLASALGMSGRSVQLIAGAAHFSGAVVWPLPVLAIWRSFAVLPWQKRAARILTIVAYVLSAAIGILLWVAILGGNYHLFVALFRIAICHIALLLVAGSAICLRRGSAPRAVFLSSWIIAGAVGIAALGFMAGEHLHAHSRPAPSVIAAAQQLPLLIVLSGFFLFSRFRFGDIFIRYSVRLWLAALAATLLAVVAQGHRQLQIVARPESATLHVFALTLLAGVLLLSFTFVDARLSGWVSRWFFRAADYRVAARELAEKLRHLQEEPDIMQAAEENARRTLELIGARIIEVEKLPSAEWPPGLHDGEIVELELTHPGRALLPLSGVELLVPIASGGRVSHVLLAAPSTERPGLVTQELNYLRTVATQCGQRIDALRAAQLLRQVTEAELRALRSQVNPHFLFNSLNTIADLIVRDPPRAEAMTLRLAGVFRHVLANTSRPLTSVRDEMEFLRTYLSIEEARFGDRLRIKFDVQPESAGAQIPSLILQPLVENALKHGLGPKPGPGNLSISACVAGAQIRLRVEDDGMGWKPSQARGTGLTNVAERLRTMYQDRAALMLDPGENGGTRVTLLIPRGNGDAA